MHPFSSLITSKSKLSACRAYHGANNFHPTKNHDEKSKLKILSQLVDWVFQTHLMPRGGYICIFANHHIKIVLHIIPIYFLSHNFTFVYSILQVWLVKWRPDQLCHIFESKISTQSISKKNIFLPQKSALFKSLTKEIIPFDSTCPPRSCRCFPVSFDSNTAS